MTIHLYQKNSLLRYTTDILLQNMLSPLCGLSQRLGLVNRSPYEVNTFTAAGELSGVHHLLGRPEPNRGGYHIGGSGIFFDEAVIKTLAESIERYAQLMIEAEHAFEFVFKPYTELDKSADMLDEVYLNFFDEQQLANQTFPFSPFNKEQPLGWIKTRSALHRQYYMWVPAQLLLIAYDLKKDQGEKCLNAAVTTGTAAHVNHELSTINAILELIQIDAAMGHWYGQGKNIQHKA